MIKKIGIIGLGNVSNKHIQSLQKLGIVDIYGYDINSNKISEFELKYGIIGLSSVSELINIVDLVSICTPHDEHIDILKETLTNNKKCIIEKPLCIYSKELEKLRNIDLQNGYIMFQNRYNNAVVKAKEIIDSGKLGNINLIKGFTKWHRDDIYYSGSDWKGKIKREGGILYNQGIHNIDTSLWLIGENNNINSIKVLSKIRDKFRGLNIETEDYFSTVLGVGNTKYEYSLITYGDKGVPENSILFIGDKGTLKIGGSALNNLDYVNYLGNEEKLNINEEFSDIYGSGHYKVYKLLIEGKYTKLPKIQDGISIINILEKLNKR